jgi:hypothetical protein
VRSVPEDLYDRVRQPAQLRNCSLGAQIVTMLYEALDDEEEQHKKQTSALASIRRRRFAPPKKAASSLVLLHEDRKR